MFDVAIIGAGVVGSASARELSRHRLSVAVFERGPDVASGASKANSGIVHAGYDAKPNSLKAEYNLAGNPLFDSLASELDFPFRRNGSLILGFGEEDLVKLVELHERGIRNGVAGLEILGQARLRGMEPNLAHDVTHALHAPTGGIVCPYEMTIAFAENAARNGVQFHLECEVIGVEKTREGFLLHTPRGEFTSRVVINAAGIGSGAINNMLSSHAIRIQPRRGEYCLLDKNVGDLVRHTLFQIPGKMGKGVLVTPTVDGNILLGPTSEDVGIDEGTGTTASGLAYVLQMARRNVERLPVESIIASFAGLRAHSLADDFIVGESPDVPGLINLAGIESPGLTSAPAIAKTAESLVVEMLAPAMRENFIPTRRAPARFRHANNEERARLIAEDPNYGHILCRCENVTKAEVLAVLRSPLAVRDIDAIKRRTRLGMGRCQSGFCGMRLPEIIAAELGVPVTEVRKSGAGSNPLVEPNKAAL